MSSINHVRFREVSLYYDIIQRDYMLESLLVLSKILQEHESRLWKFWNKNSSDKSSDKIDEILTWCRKFCPTKFCPIRYILFQNRLMGGSNTSNLTK